MAQCTAQDLIARINAHGEALGEDLIGLVEDINDSITQPTDLSGYVEKTAYDELQRKYIERFEHGDGLPKKEEPPVVDVSQLSYDDILYGGM